MFWNEKPKKPFQPAPNNPVREEKRQGLAHRAPYKSVPRKK